jgi:4-hydroxybenzoate polyprenyltransferase
MTTRFSERLLSVLQLTRMALVFTAIADSFAAMLLWAGREGGADYLGYLSTRRIVAVGLVSTGLYGFGMSLNDIIDRRRDRQIAAHRPLPSGRIGLIPAHIICALLGLTALLAGIQLAQSPNTGTLSLILLVWTMALIAFYDFAGKYLVAPGLLSLGLIRFFHATIPAPHLPMLWHPLLLLNHVSILSAIAYTWEEKRPSLTRLHWWAIAGGLAIVDATCIILVWFRRQSFHELSALDRLWITPGLLVPAIAVVLFLIVAELIWLRSADTRAAGRNLMLAGLLWLIVYDASFVAGYVDWRAAIVLLLLLPVAYFSVTVMRWWAKIVLLSQRPEYQRAR